MTIADPAVEQRLRMGFKYLNQFMLFMWQLGLGSLMNIWPDVFGQIMVITHTGRKTGIRRRTPVNYVDVDGDLYCVAGFGAISDWYRNVLHNPGVEVWLPAGWWAGSAQDISTTPNRTALIRKVIKASGFAGYLAGLDANKMSDEQLNELTSSYRLVQIKRSAACTGRGGPGELSWIWPITTFILLPMALFRRRK